MNTDLQQLLSIIEDTKTLIDLAEEGDWQAVVNLENTRDGAIKKLFRSAPDIDADKLAEGIQFILEKNKTLTQFSHSQRDSVQMNMAKAGHAHKAINSYLTSS
ncbi:MAG: flagellar protein FliT [Piscirickettsiaceae bacterium]|nr:MAG: flagellar protein FliT [Piscirickettsiaceae bacterium]PCI66147.1 MAG: flagellar protein FliT [Piscirickettsiaceae bacterium]